MAVYPLPGSSVQGPAFTHRQLAASIAANDSTYPQYRFQPGSPAAIVRTAAESTALGATWTNYPVPE